MHPTVPLSDDTFTDVLDAARSGDQAAFATLWNRFNTGVVRYLRTALPGSADDIASETWMTAARRLDSFSGGEQEFRAWLFTVARHRLIDWQRFHARRPAIAVDPAELASDERAPDVAELVVEHIDTDAAIDLIGRLAPRQAEVVSLLVIGGLDVAQVAAIVGIEPATVRVHLHRGLRRLAELVADPAHEPSRAQ